jgi:ATP-dependent protease Clp ATPase subunit
MELRKKNGLCFKCGAKWGHNHKCPNQVPLHVLEEVLDALEPTDFQDDELETKVEEKVVLAVSSSKGFKGVKRRTMRISGVIGKLNVLILINSGSVGTFISEQLARKLQLDTVPCS